jgi:ABC-type lipoprotein release transport system permease subunit
MLRGLLVVWKLSLKSVFSNWHKNKVIISIIAVSFILIQILLSIAEGFGNQVKNFALDSLVGNLKIMNPNYKIDSSLKNNFIISDELLDKISKINGVKGVTKRIQVPVVLKSEREIKNGVLVGIDTSNEKDLSFIGKSYDYNKFANVFKDDNTLIGQKLLGKLKTKKSFKIVVAGQSANDKLIESAYFIQDTYVSGLPKVEETFVFANIKAVAKIYNMKNSVTEVSIILFNDDDLPRVYSEIEPILPEKTKLYTWGDINPFIKNWLDMMSLNMMIFFSIIFFAATIPLANTILISFLERIHEFGILQSLGFRKSYLFMFIMCESTLILIIGISIGLIVGLVISCILASIGIDISPFAKGAGNLGLGNYIYPKVNIINTLKVAGLMLSLGIVASLYPSIRATLYNPIQALSKRG